MLRNLMLICCITLTSACGIATVEAPMFNGKPSFTAGGEQGMFVWQDRDKIMVRFNAGSGTMVFEGKVCGAEVKSMQRIRAEGTDRVRVGPKRKCVHYDVTVGQGVDGFDTVILGKKVIFEQRSKPADARGKPRVLKRGEISIGARSIHPPASPFAMDRAR